MSGLTETRDHMRKMATARHSAECHKRANEDRGRRAHLRLFGEWPESWGERPSGPTKPCAGECVTDSDRELWTKLADEIDAYLADDERSDEGPGLFGVGA